MKTVLKIVTATTIILLIAFAAVVADANLRIADEEVLAADSGAPGRFVTVDGRRLHVVTVGDVATDPSGAPLLLIHGFAAPGHVTWLPWASRLAGQRAFIMPDLLGFGHSDRIGVPDAAYTLKSRAAALAAVLDALSVGPVDVVGESYGGAVAAQFALDYPTRVPRIIFMDAAIYPRPNPLEFARGLPLGLGRAITWHALTGGPFGFIGQYCKDQPNCRWLRLARIAGTTDALTAMLST